jgi:hypothetical protein
MRTGWAFLAIGSAVVLAGCGGQSKREAIAECHMEAAKVYERQTEVNDPVRAADFVYFCMQSKGYLIPEPYPKGCSYADGVQAQTSAECYRRAHFWE